MTQKGESHSREFAHEECGPISRDLGSLDDSQRRTAQAKLAWRCRRSHMRETYHARAQQTNVGTRTPGHLPVHHSVPALADSAWNIRGRVDPKGPNASRPEFPAEKRAPPMARCVPWLSRSGDRCCQRPLHRELRRCAVAYRLASVRSTGRDGCRAAAARSATPHEFSGRTGSLYPAWAFRSLTSWGHVGKARTCQNPDSRAAMTADGFRS
jgi:hypothetical protein